LMEVVPIIFMTLDLALMEGLPQLGIGVQNFKKKNIFFHDVIMYIHKIQNLFVL